MLPIFTKDNYQGTSIVSSLELRDSVFVIQLLNQFFVKLKLKLIPPQTFMVLDVPHRHYGLVAAQVALPHPLRVLGIVSLLVQPPGHVVLELGLVGGVDLPNASPCCIRPSCLF